MTPLAIVWNLADSWLHFHQLEICPPGNTKSIINRIGLCLVMKTMILTMVYLSWWAGSVQWRLQSLYDEVKIRRHVNKIYYLCLLKTLRQSHQWWHQESSIPSATLSSSVSITLIATSNIISISITNRQSYNSKVLSRYLHSPGSHLSTRFNSVTHWQLSLQAWR